MSAANAGSGIQRMGEVRDEDLQTLRDTGFGRSPRARYGRLSGSRRSVRLGLLTGLCALAGCNPPAPHTAAQVAENPSLLPADLKPFSRFDAQARRLTTAELKSLFVDIT